MAEFTADLSPKSNSTSLSDLLKMSYYAALGDTAQYEADIARAKQSELPKVQAILKDPSNKLEDGNFDLNKINQLLPTIAPLSGPEYAKKITDLTKNHIEAAKSQNELSQQERSYIGSVYGAHAAAGTQDPKEVIASLDRLKELNPNLAKTIDYHVKNLAHIPGGPDFVKGLYQARNEVLTPTQLIDQFAPKATTAKIGGADVPVVSQPSVRGEAPSITPTQFGSGTGGYNAPSTKERVPEEAKSGTLPKLVNYGTDLKYKGDPALFNLNTAQQNAYEIGDKVVNSIGAGIKAAKDIQQPIRKVEEFINSASGSKLYQTLQAGGKYAWGNADLDSLVKNIAQVQARNAEVMGLSKTDHMQELNAKLSGSEKIDPKALAGVMQQVKADAVAAEKYNMGLQKFVEKHGDINGRILANKFQQAWADNYDPRIFQIQNIENSQLPEKEQERRIREIHGTMSKDEFKDLENKAKILHRLEKGLYQ